jgi:hypothetical protein
MLGKRQGCPCRQGPSAALPPKLWMTPMMEWNENSSLEIGWSMIRRSGHRFSERYRAWRSPAVGNFPAIPSYLRISAYRKVFDLEPDFPRGSLARSNQTAS